MISELTLYAARLVHFGATMVIFGGALFPFYAGERVAAPAPLVLRWIALGSALAWASCVIVNIGGPQALLDMQTLRAIAFDTSFGGAWLVHIVLSFLLLALPNQNERARMLFCVLAGLNLASLAGLGHAAMDMGALGFIHTLVDALHLLAGGAWLGGLSPLRRVLTSLPPELAQRVVQRFSRMGYCAVAIVVATGIANMRWVTAAFIPDLHIAYGFVLTTKLAFVAALIAVAAFNHVAFRRTPGAMALMRTIVLEHMLFACILGAVSVLGVLPPT